MAKAAKKQKPKHWFVVRFNASGSVKNVRRVLLEEASELSIVYVRAVNAEEAAVAGYRMRQRLMMKRRREEYKSRGLCRCGRTLDVDGQKRCSLCGARGRAYQQRAKLKTEGEVIVPPPKREAFKRLEIEKRETTRLDVLLEVRQAWQDASTNGAFTRWLNDAIKALEVRAA